jgi:hypothetical protein
VKHNKLSQALGEKAGFSESAIKLFCLSPGSITRAWTQNPMDQKYDLSFVVMFLCNFSEGHKA